MRQLIENVRILTILTVLLLTFSLQAKELPGKRNNRVSTSVLAKVEDCNPPIAYTEFALNNVRFGLEAGGQIWENNGDAAYSIPKVDLASGEIPIHSLYAGALWLGGYSPDGQLKLAAVTYRTGGATDFYNGPLSNDNFATADFCGSYDRHFFANRTDCQVHRAFYSASEEEVEQLFPDGYSIPSYFNDWPAQNLDAIDQGLPFEEYLAPFFDYDGDGEYDPSAGDYPGYDLDQVIDCRTRDRRDPIPLFGDQTLWWVFNDNGGIHTETGGQNIGMEIQAQAFAYNTTDQVNNMTFYNYTLINRGTQTLERCYFGQWVDPDVGCPTDDFVGCDVQRGLGYTYNGDDNDADCDGVPGYGPNPPAVGIDFFEGPYQDDDGINNPLTPDLGEVEAFDGIPYKGIGIGYFDVSLDEDDPFQDNIVDNERFGMRRFVYYNRDDQTATPDINGEPNIAIEFYNYLDGIWKNGEQMTYGGNGVGGSVPTDYMFPGLTDPLGFATNGAITNDEWTEAEEGNQPGDRRFIQSAGTFVLDPGEFNNITVGVVWARPFSDPETTLNSLRIADDKAQSLFDNCFRIISGPDAPDMSAQELDGEIILYLENENPTSNNFREGYGFPSTFAFDPSIPDETSEGVDLPAEAKYFEFEGYKIYQLKDNTVSSSELSNPDLARLQFQVDKENGIGQIINYVDDPQLGTIKVPVEAVNGADQGLRQSFRVTRDLFAEEDQRIVNFKKYYFMAIAYAYNEYEQYNPITLNGQALPYLESRKAATGAIPVITAIPHKPLYEAGGTVTNVEYGFVPQVTRIEGEGNGGLNVDITEDTRMSILESEFNIVDNIVYQPNAAPIAVTVVDPINVQEADFVLRMFPDTTGGIDIDDIVDDWDIEDADRVNWYLVNTLNNDTIFGNRSIGVGGEQLILKYGISISLTQSEFSVVEGTNNVFPEIIESTVEYADPEKAWYTGVPDLDFPSEQNWIRSGTSDNSEDPDCAPEDPSSNCYYDDYIGIDPSEVFEDVLFGTISPWHVAGEHRSGPADGGLNSPNITRLSDLNNVDIHMTADKTYWTRVPVLEIQFFEELSAGGAEKLYPRIALSVDKNGLSQVQGGDFDECTMNGTQLLTEDMLDDLSNSEKDQYKLAVWPTDNPDTHADEELLDYSFGMGWFPGYTIDVETGERCNMAIAENSALGAENGRDMIWNPTSQIWNPFNSSVFDPNNARFGGMHYYYVFRNENRNGLKVDRMPQYDDAQFLFYNIGGSNVARRSVFRACTWVGLPLASADVPLLTPEEGLIPTDTKIRLRVEKPYRRYATVGDIYDQYLVEDEDEPNTLQFPSFFWDDESGILDAEDFDPSEEALVGGATEGAILQSENDWYPMYTFNTRGLGATTGESNVVEAALDGINVVPNPYYGFAPGPGYEERSRLDTRVKIINLPERCIIRIFDTSGTLVRTFDKDSPATFLDWDLKNERNVPIAGGVHIVHIEVPGVGETIVKWFGAMRPIDLNNF